MIPDGMAMLVALVMLAGMAVAAVGYALYGLLVLLPMALWGRVRGSRPDEGES